MVRSRWAALALGCCALLFTGCSNNCSDNGLFSRFRLTSRTAPECDCMDTSFGSPAFGPSFGDPGVGSPSCGVPGLEGGPLLTPPGAGPTFGEPPALSTPPLAPPPRIVPIPHAAPMPYTPTNTSRVR